MASYNVHNPLRRVNGVYVPVPSSYVWNSQDISQPDAGRTEDGLMHKKKMREAIKLEVSWQNIKTSVLSEILNAFSTEYLTVEYLDAKSGSYQTKVFYIGDRNAPAYNASLDIWSSVSFNLIER